MSEIKELYNRKDQMIHFTLADGMVRGLLCTAVNTVAKGAAIHCATPVVAAALGRTLMGTAMMGAMLKGDEARLQERPPDPSPSTAEDPSARSSA